MDSCAEGDRVARLSNRFYLRFSCGDLTLWKVHTSTTLGMIPRLSEVPCIVCVFPLEVTPYANTVTIFRRRQNRFCWTLKSNLPDLDIH
jgi:hypothetical protein